MVTLGWLSNVEPEITELHHPPKKQM